MFRAHVDTDHFEFEAFGETEAKARAALAKGFRKHEQEYKVPRGQLQRLYGDGVYAYEIRLGEAQRDREPLTWRVSK